MQKETFHIFNQILNLVDDVLENPDQFGNGTGYYDSLCYQNFDDISPKKFVDSSGRYGIVFPVKSHRNMIPNQVFFQRYADEKLIIAQHDDDGEDREARVKMTLKEWLAALETPECV